MNYFFKLRTCMEVLSFFVFCCYSKYQIRDKLDNKMGSSASVDSLPVSLDREKCLEILGEKFDEARFSSEAINGFVPATRLVELMNKEKISSIRIFHSRTRPFRPALKRILK